MRNLHTKFKWLATDANGKTFAYTHKPVIQCNGWGSCHPCDLVSTGEPTKDWQNTLKPIDHFADVPERFKFIGITKFGLKFATTHKPTILQSHWGTDDVMSECITVGNLGKYCNDWGTSLVELEEQKPVDLRTECKTLRKQLGDSEQSRVSLQIKNAQLEKENEKLKQEKQDLRVQYDSKINQMEAHKNKIRLELSTEHLRANRLILELSASKSALGALDENAEHFQKENKNMHNQNQDLREKLNNAYLKFSMAESINLILNTEVDKLKIKLQDCKTELSASKGALGAHNAHLRTENKKLLDATAQFQIQVEKLRLRNDRLLKANMQLICERQRLENQLGASEILQAEAYELKAIVEKMREVLK